MQAFLYHCSIFYAAATMFIGGGYQFVEYKVAGSDLMFDTTASEITEKTGADSKTGDALHSGISVDFNSIRMEIFSGVRF